MIPLKLPSLGLYFWLTFVWNDGEEDEDFYSTLPLVVNLHLAWTYYTLILLSFFVLWLFYPTNMLEVNNGNTRGKCEIWCSKPTKKDTRTVLVFLLQTCTYFTHFSSVFIIDFEQVHVCCVMTFVTPSNRQIQTT